MVTDEFRLVVSEGKKSMPENILAAVFFSVTVFLLMATLISVFFGNLGEFMTNLHGTLGIGLFSFLTGLKFATTKTVLIDTQKDQLISRYQVGPFSYNPMSAIPQLEYVAVFLNAKDYYEVNLWYKGNKHYNMFNFEEKDSAFKFAAMVAEKLKIDQLDATRKGDFKWIEQNSL